MFSGSRIPGLRRHHVAVIMITIIDNANHGDGLPLRA